MGNGLEQQISALTPVAAAGDGAAEVAFGAEAENGEAENEAENGTVPFILIDLGGDGDQGDTGELHDDATFTAANELTARDIDDDGTDDYTFQPDAVGNMVDDGQYLFTYDVFGRLVEIQDQSSNTVAEYRYNGLGQRIMSLIDTDSSGVVDGSDTKRYLVYDDKWRVVAEFADTQSDPTIQYTHHAAGLSGRGGSTSLDNMICCDIDKNGGFSSPDGTLEVREYYCHNYRGDVCARVTSDGTMIEWTKYSAYGVPFAIPAGDTDGDGDADQTDLGAILSGIGGAHAVVKDLDLDYDVDAGDLSAFSIATLGRGVLSGDDEYQHNGYTGHRHDEANPILVHARNRVLHTELGRWLRRDPLGYVDGMSLYQYVGGRGIVAMDPSGHSALCCDGQLLAANTLLLNRLISEVTTACGVVVSPTCNSSCIPANDEDSHSGMTNLCGQTLGWGAGVAIGICLDSWGCSRCDVLETLRHEYTHAWQRCKNGPTDNLWPGCQTSDPCGHACFELGAYANDGGNSPCRAPGAEVPGSPQRAQCCSQLGRPGFPDYNECMAMTEGQFTYCRNHAPPSVRPRSPYRAHTYSFGG